MKIGLLLHPTEIKNYGFGISLIWDFNVRIYISALPTFHLKISGRRTVRARDLKF